MANRPEVLIVGAGPVGLTAALALARAGIEIRLIDAATTVDRRMRASTFHPPTLDMVDDLGLGAALCELGLRVPRWQIRQHESEEAVEFDLAAIAGDTRHPYRLQCEQHRYCSLAVDALAGHGIEVEFDLALDSFAQDDNGLDVRLGDGSAMHTAWLIGADGAGSRVRGALGVDYGGMTYEHSSVLVSTAFPFHEALPGIADVTYCWSERGPFSLLRLKRYWRASLYPGLGDLDAVADEERVRDWLAFIHPDARDATILDVGPYRVHERCVDRFRHGRVLLAGDAAHLNPPSGGMGMNGGIHDSMNLAENLTAVIRGANDGLLDRYDRQRRFVAAERVIPQASANRARMATVDTGEQGKRIEAHREIAADPDKHYDYLLRTSMITGLREAATIE